MRRNSQASQGQNANDEAAEVSEERRRQELAPAGDVQEPDWVSEAQPQHADRRWGGSLRERASCDQQARDMATPERIGESPAVQMDADVDRVTRERKPTEPAHHSAPSTSRV